MNPARDFGPKMFARLAGWVKLRLPAVGAFLTSGAAVWPHRRRHSGRVCLSQILWPMLPCDTCVVEEGLHRDHTTKCFAVI